MNNENFENITTKDKIEEAKKIEFLQNRINYLEKELIIVDDNFKEKQKNTESIKKELNGTQVTLSQIEEILDKLKTNEAGIYEIPASELKDIQNLLYGTRN